MVDKLKADTIFVALDRSLDKGQLSQKKETEFQNVLFCSDVNLLTTTI